MNGWIMISVGFLFLVFIVWLLNGVINEIARLRIERYRLLGLLPPRRSSDED